MSGLRVALAIAAKDLRIEHRSRTAIMTAVLFAVLVQVIMVFARDSAVDTLRGLAPSVLWITLALASVVTMNRSFLLEREHSAMESILLAPAPRAALFWGKWLANLVFMMSVVAVAFPLWVIFFDLEFTAAIAGVLLLTVLSAIGIAAIGTMLSAMVVRTRFAEMLLPVLMFPFMIPPTYFAAQATVRLLNDPRSGDLGGAFRILVLFDLAFLVVAQMLFPTVVDE